MSHENSKTVQIKDKFYNMPSKFGKHELSEAQIKMLIKNGMRPTSIHGDYPSAIEAARSRSRYQQPRSSLRHNHD